MPEWISAAWNWAVAFATPHFVQTLVATVAGAVSGTLAGTLPIFWVQRRMAFLAERDKHVTSSRRVQYALVRRYEFLVSIGRQFIKELRETPADKLNVTRFEHRWGGPRLELEQLEFMVSRGGAETFHRLDHKSNQFDMLIADFDQRNEFMKSITGDIHARGTAATEVPRQLYEEVQHRNFELIKTYDAASEGMFELMDELRAVLLKIYPKQSFIRIEKIETKDAVHDATKSTPR